MTVPAKKAYNFSFAVQVPPTAKAGAYVMGIVAEYSPGTSVVKRGARTFDITMEVRSVALLGVRTPGTLTFALKVSGLKISAPQPGSALYTVKSSVRNDGNAYEYVTPTLTLHNGSRKRAFSAAPILLLAHTTSAVVFQVPAPYIGKNTVGYVVVRGPNHLFSSVSGPLRPVTATSTKTAR